MIVVDVLNFSRNLVQGVARPIQASTWERQEARLIFTADAPAAGAGLRAGDRRFPLRGSTLGEALGHRTFRRLSLCSSAIHSGRAGQRGAHR